MNIAKFLRAAFYLEHLKSLRLNSNLILAMQIVTKTKKKLFLYFDNSHANQANSTKYMIFFFIDFNISENLKKINEKKSCLKCV